ncbi:MAG: DUF938 domain-containing protein [Planctomycetota bacterium]
MKRYAPATERNRAPILEVLRQVLPSRGTVLEIASGSGEHAVFFAGSLSGVTWQPTDPDPDAIASIAEWRAEASLPNLRPPLQLDVTAPWPVHAADAIVCINMLHIAPWAAAEALFAGAARVLAADAPLVTYGPYRFGGSFAAESNATFDQDLRSRDPRWGVRDVDDLDVAAARQGLARVATVALPANNHVLVWRAGQPQARPNQASCPGR